MAKDLAVLEDQAEPFSNWVEEQKNIILAKRCKASARPGSRPQLAPSPPPQGQGPPAGAPARGSGQQPGGHFVVVTQKLVLQPNRETGASGSSGSSRRPVLPAAAPAAPATTVLASSRGGSLGKAAATPEVIAANNRKLELLAEMTKRLREIINRLQDRHLDDQSREKYQALAQSIQNQMAGLNASVRPAARLHP
mmetsp:Transcript_105730/g.303870  ORF Transcript_105730/g.303870 Transcript_105730/m.303870 type:complete len:195 (+) Transcript_105730:528-1112(+)